jgi:hypothetical protein
VDRSRTISAELDEWLADAGPKTLGSLIELFQEKSFAILFIVLLGVPALPLPTGGATHVFELIAMLLAVQLIAGRDRIWLPQRWRERRLEGPRMERFLGALMRVVRWLERHSRPRVGILFGHRASAVVFGLLAFGGTLGAFLAPPFTGLDTLPAMGVVLLSLGVLLEDGLVVIAGVAIAVAGVAFEIALGRAAFRGLSDLL